ncbi:6-hydroxymethylpterin diphosphokinase MptE-like protein [Shewanella sp.]|uniref:motility associated factor glycosyltransferase family protein n=1 Tax=Shewanella sp. TaxID=50422 RepID=UPI00356271BD
MSIETTIPAIFSVSQFGETYLPGVNRGLFENQPSAEIFSREYSGLFNNEDHLHVIVGLDSGLLANYVLEHPLPNGSRYLFVELDAVMELMNINIPKQLHSKVQILSQSQFEAIIDENPFPVYFTKKATQLHKSQGAKYAHVTEYVSLFTHIEKIIEQQTFKHSVGLTQKLFIQRQLENLPDNQIPAKVLKDSFLQKDCVILAGGPSLDEHLPWVIRNQQHLVIIAVSRISRQLLSHNLIPDIVVSVDPQEVSFDVSKEMLKLPQSVLFINCNHVEPRLLANWHGQSVFTGQRLPWEAEHDIGNIQTQGPTVTNAALHIAIKMGFGRIFLSGTDLCYASNGVTHAKGSHEAAIGANMVVIGEWVDTYQGTQAETSIQMLYALQALEEEASTLPNTQRVFNLAPQAAKAKGIPHQSIDTIQLGELIKGKQQLLMKLSSPLGGEDKAKYFQNMSSSLKQSLCHLADISALCREALKYNDSLKKAQKVHSHSNTYYQSLTGRIDAIEKQLNTKFGRMEQFLKFFGYAEFTQFLTPMDSCEWQQDDMFSMTDAYYRAFVASSEQLRSLIQIALERLELRMSELHDGSEINSLLNGWQKFNQFGRAQLWSRHHPIPASFESQFAALQNKLNTIIEEKPELAKRIIQLNSALNFVEQKLLLLKEARNQSGLAQMVAILKTKASRDVEAQRLYRLAECFLFELQGNSKSALSSLLHLDEANLTEREYKEMASLGLKVSKPEISLLALAKLVEYSDEYCPLYASVQKLTGQYQAAAETYLEYLNKYPGDVVTWIKFGQFMVDAGERDMAISAFHQAEQADPGNAVAKHYLSELYRQ